jgi:hypothetical protein
MYILSIRMNKKSIQADSLALALFTSRARLAVLALLFVDPDRRFYLREIAEPGWRQAAS